MTTTQHMIQIEPALQQWFIEAGCSDGGEDGEFTVIDPDLMSNDAYQVKMIDGVMQLFEPVVAGRAGQGMGKSATKALQHVIDIERFTARQGSFPASKKDLLGQAIGRKTETVIDATAGWAGDSLHFCSQGYQVSCIERSRLLCGFLREAMNRLAASAWVQQNTISVPRIIAADAIEYLSKTSPAERPDCIYLDPMFPEKRKRSALAKKNMQILQQIVGKDLDQEQLFLAAYHSANRRVVVKRPDHADSLGVANGVKPSQQLRGKLLRYDVYLKP